MLPQIKVLDKHYEEFNEDLNEIIKSYDTENGSIISLKSLECGD